MASKKTKRFLDFMIILEVEYVSSVLLGLYTLREVFVFQYYVVW